MHAAGSPVKYYHFTISQDQLSIGVTDQKPFPASCAFKTISKMEWISQELAQGTLVCSEGERKRLVPIAEEIVKSYDQKQSPRGSSQERNVMRDLLEKTRAQMGFVPSDPQQKSKGYQALAMAIDREDTQALDQLLRLGEKPSGELLHLAVAKPASLLLVSVLFQHGADVHATDSDGMPVIFRAAALGANTTLLRLKSQGARFDVPNHQGDYPLHVAAINGQVGTVALMIQEGVACDQPGAMGRTPLCAACTSRLRDCRAVIELLLINWASPNTPAANGDYPLHIVAKAGRVDLAAALCNGRIKIELDARDAGRLTALDHALAGKTIGHLAVVALLQQMGAQTKLPLDFCEQLIVIDKC